MLFSASCRAKYGSISPPNVQLYLSSFFQEQQLLKLETSNFPRNSQELPIKYTVTCSHTFLHHQPNITGWSNRRLGTVVQVSDPIQGREGEDEKFDMPKS